MKWQSRDFSNEFHRAAPAITHSSLLKWSFLHKLILGWVCTNKVHYYYKPWHGVERTQSCSITGAISLRYSRAPRGNLRQMFIVHNTRAQKSQDFGTRGSCHFQSPYERGTCSSESSDKAQFPGKMPLFQLPPHICVVSLPQQAFVRIVFLLHNRNQLD